MNEYNTEYETLNDLAPTQSTVAIDNLFTSPDEVSRSARLEQAKQQKLDRLSRVNQKASFDDSYTDLGDGRLESNRNKVWNDLSDQEFQSVFDYGVSNYALTRNEDGKLAYASGEVYSGPTRRLYMFGTNDSDTGVKFGVARGDLEGSEARYTPEGIVGGYGWAPGRDGVDVEDKQMDILLPDNVATMLEGLGHGRTSALENRTVKDRFADPEAAARYGSGVSEYYTSREGLFGAPTELDVKLGEELFTQYLTDVQRMRPRGGIVNREAEIARIQRENQELAADHAGTLDRLANTGKGFLSSFVDSLIVSPLDALGDATGLYDIGSGDANTEAVNDFFGYNPVQAERAMETISKQWEIATDDNSTKAEAVKAVGNGILEAFITPEMWGTSMGTLASWVMPGSVLKLAGVGSKYANTVKALDAAAETGQITKAAARAEKAKAFMSIDGAKAALAAQSGFIVSATGSVNKQYEEFVENNNGVELEGAEKAAWLSTRFAVQMVNQNLDKIVDFQVIKAPGVIAGLVPAVKGMTNKEFAKTAKAMGKGVVVTGTAMGAEAAQEYTQTMMEVFNSRYGSEKFSDVGTFAEFITDDRNTTEAAIAAIAGAGGAPQFEVVGSILPAAVAVGSGLKKAGTAANNAIRKTTPPVQAEVQVEAPTPVTETESVNASAVVGKYADMFSDDEFVALHVAETPEEERLTSSEVLKTKLAENPSEYAGAIDEIEKAEAAIQARVDAGNAQETDAISFKVLRSAKREVYKALMGDDSQPTLGSGTSAEYVLEEFLDAVDEVDGELDLTDEEKVIVENYAKANDLPPLRFTSFRKAKGKTSDVTKDASGVYEDSIKDGPRSASNYRKKLKALVSSADPNTAAIQKTVEDMDKFLLTQENRKAAYDAVLKEVKADVANYNKNRNTVPVSVKAKLKRGRDEIPGYPNAFISVSEDSTGKLRVNEQSIAVSDSIQDTINYIQRTKAILGPKLSKTVKEEYSTDASGINVRPNVAIPSRADDESFYTKRNVTKAIIDPNAHSKKWGEGSDYRADNTSKINTNEYTEDDVVVINSTAKVFPKGGHIRKQVAAAYAAGATIVLDNDKQTTANGYLKKLLKSYHFEAVKEDGINKYLPTGKAKEVKEIAAQEAAEKVKKTDNLKALIKAIDSGDQEAADRVITEEFGGDKTKAASFYNNLVSKKSEEIKDKLFSIALSEGFDSAALADAMVKVMDQAKKGVLPRKAVSQAFAEVTARVEELEKGSELLAEWKQAAEDAKRGKGDFNTWLESKEGLEPMRVLKDVFENSIGAGKGVSYTYFNKAKNDFTTPSKVDRDVPRDDNGDISVPYQIIELDPNTYAEVSRVTPLNTLSVEELRVVGDDALQFNSLIDEAVEALETAVRVPETEYKGKSSVVGLSDGQAATLYYDKDMNVSPNVAVAMRIALSNFSKNSKHLLKKGKKSRAEVAEVLGIDEVMVTKDIMNMMADKGILYKTAANSVGRDIAGLLGISRKSDSDADKQAYDALVADLGQTALVTGQNLGALAQDNSTSAEKFAETVLGKKAKASFEANSGSGINAKVVFIEAADPEVLDTLSEEAQAIAEILPDSDTGRKEPKFKRMSKKEVSKAASKIRNEKLGLNVAEESQKALTTLMNTEWSADLVAMADVLENEKLIKERLGYVEIGLGSDAYEKLSHAEKEVQEAVNRGLDKSFEEMRWLVEGNKDATEVSMWFKYFFSKNGRFFIDSNTINPQTDKHLHRFLVQPKSHTNTYKVSNGKFAIGGKDVTSNVHYALAQAFGFATDKKDTAKAEALAKLALSKLSTEKAVKKAKKKFLKTGEFVLSYTTDAEGSKVPDQVIEVEHLGHALQGFDFLAKVAKGGEFSSALTAEFDAVTSGFGLKLLQMPIIDNLYSWLKKVGVVLDTDEVLTAEQVISMNDILDSGNVRDAYQTLAAEVGQLSFERMYTEVVAMTDGRFQAISDTKYHRNLWEAITHPDVLPQVSSDGKVSSALRSVFKAPFMTFNYSASINSIRKNALPEDMVPALAKKMAGVDVEDETNPVVVFMEAIAGKGKARQLQQAVRSKPLNEIHASDFRKKGESANLELVLSQMVEASYGAEVDRILTSQFQPFIDAQNAVNGGFKAIFEVFATTFNEKLEEARKKGKVTAKDERAIYESLKDRWPAIKGPLSKMEKEYAEDGGVGIYDTQSASPYGSHSGRKPSRVNLSAAMEKKSGQKTVRVSHIVKELTSAVAAGSVVPIHYIDGAVMATTINTLSDKGIEGITAVHDAIIPPLVSMGEAQQAYNAQMVKVNKDYSFIDELQSVLQSVVSNVPMDSKAYKEKRILRKGKNISVRKLVKDSHEAMTALANLVNSKRNELYSELNKGAKVMHMAGTPEGVYSIEPGSIDFTPVEEKAIKRYDEGIKVDGLSTNDLSKMAQNLC